MLESVLFDLDGTLINTNDHIINALLKAMQRESQVKVTREEIAGTFGIPLEKAIQGFDKKNWINILNAYHEFANLKGYDDVSLFDNALTILTHLKEKNIKTAIVTSRRRNNAINYLKHFKMANLFDVVIGPEDCKHHKPHPEPVLLALKYLDSEPSKSCMVGDSPFDIMAANEAKVISIGVSYTAIDFSLLEQAKPQKIINNLIELRNFI